MVTVNDFKKYFDKLVKDGKGEKVIKTMYDGFINNIDNVEELFEEVHEKKYGVCEGEVLKGEILISTN